MYKKRKVSKFYGSVEVIWKDYGWANENGTEIGRVKVKAIFYGLPKI